MYSQCLIPTNLPLMIQRDVLVCQQSICWRVNLQTYIAAAGRCFLCACDAERSCSPSICFDPINFALFDRLNSHSSALEVVCISEHTVIERINQLRVLLKKSYLRTKWWEPLNSPCTGLANSWRQVDYLGEWPVLLQQLLPVDPSTSRDLCGIVINRLNTAPQPT